MCCVCRGAPLDHTTPMGTGASFLDGTNGALHESAQEARDPKIRADSGALFKLLDKDGSGTLEYKEIGRFLQTICGVEKKRAKSSSKKLTAAVGAVMDTDGHVDSAEFVSLFAAHDPDEVRPALAAFLDACSQYKAGNGVSPETQQKVLSVLGLGVAPYEQTPSQQVTPIVLFVFIC